MCEKLKYYWEDRFFEKDPEKECENENKRTKLKNRIR